MTDKSKKTPCIFGAKCYQKKKTHLDKYSHPDRESEDKDEEDEPRRKKTKIDDFFGATGESGYKRETKEEEAVDAAEPSSSTEAAPPSQSGYVRQPEKKDSTNDIEVTPPSPKDIRENIKSKFLVELPEDFYHFWELAKKIHSKSPLKAFQSGLGLRLVGPFDILNGSHAGKQVSAAAYLRHWRYYYDPPEFQTVISGDSSTQFHMGYFRDDPKELPVFVASNSADDNCILTPRGDNIFSAVLWFLQDKMKKDKVKGGYLAKLRDRITEAAEEHGYSLETKTKDMKARDKKVVCKSFHSAGIVVPVDENEVGYRPVPETPGDLKKMFKNVVAATNEDARNKAMDPIMEIVMLIQFANDECDYGEGLELGMDMFSHGGDIFHKMILNLLPLAYKFLRRPEFGQIIEAHLKDRKHTADLSVLG